MCTSEAHKSAPFCKPSAVFKIMSYFACKESDVDRNMEVESINTSEVLVNAENELLEAINRAMQVMLHRKIANLTPSKRKEYMHRQRQLQGGREDGIQSLSSAWVGLGDFTELDAIEISLDDSFWRYDEGTQINRSSYTSSKYQRWVSRLCEVFTFSYERPCLVTLLLFQRAELHTEYVSTKLGIR